MEEMSDHLWGPFLYQISWQSIVFETVQSGWKTYYLESLNSFRTAKDKKWKSYVERCPSLPPSKPYTQGTMRALTGRVYFDHYHHIAQSCLLSSLAFFIKAVGLFGCAVNRYFSSCISDKVDTQSVFVAPVIIASVIRNDSWGPVLLKCTCSYQRCHHHMCHQSTITETQGYCNWTFST